MICKNCGSTIDEGAVFCSECGAKAVSAPSRPADTVGAAEPVREAASQTQAAPVHTEPAAPAGAQTSSVQAATAAPQIPVQPADRAPAPAPDGYAHTPAANTATPPVHQPVQQQPLQPSVQQQFVKPPKHKEFFGVGAFVLCLVVIALLAGTSGAFAYLYFSLLGTI